MNLPKFTPEHRAMIARHHAVKALYLQGLPLKTIAARLGYAQSSLGNLSKIARRLGAPARTNGRPRKA